jgi:hypothetical protein
MAIDRLAARYDRIVYIDGDIVLFTPVDFSEIPEFSTLLAAVYDFVSYMDYDGHGAFEVERPPRYRLLQRRSTRGQRCDLAAQGAAREVLHKPSPA